MEKRALLITLGVFGTLAAIGTTWWAIDRFNKKNKPCNPGSHKDENGNCVPDEIKTPPSGGGTGGGPKNNTSSGGGNTSAPSTGGTATSQPTKKFDNFYIGQNLFAYSNPTNVYTAPNASMATLYKSFKPNSFVGTYLGKGDVFFKIAVTVKGLWGDEAREMYVRKGHVSAVN